MHKTYTVLLGVLLVNSTALYANNNIDSIGVENNKGKKVIIYKVDAKETYYSISKKYNINYKDIMEFNDNQFLQIGVILKVPTQIPFTGEINTPLVSNYPSLIEYTIKPKDNLNMLAEKYGTTVNEIKSLNNLTTINLKIGQVLQIPSSGMVTDKTNNTVVSTYTPPTKSVDVITPIAAYTPPSKASVGANEDLTTHIIKAKENLNLIAQMYNTTVEEIKILNGLTSNNLQINQVLKIPAKPVSTQEPNSTSIQTNEITTIPKKVIVQPIETIPSKPLEKEKIVKSDIQTDQVDNEYGIEHVVTTSETIYSIAKKYRTTTYQIKTANNLNSNDLKVGQKLKIKSLEPIAVNTPELDNDVSVESIVTPKLNGPPSKYGISQVEEKGVAVWIIDQDLDPAKMLILHRIAPVGTVIKITNPMTNRSTFAKVVGKFTENETTKDVIIVMTKAVADAIGALDKRFACTLSYGAIENEQ